MSTTTQTQMTETAVADYFDAEADARQLAEYVDWLVTEHGFSVLEAEHYALTDEDGNDPLAWMDECPCLDTNSPCDRCALFVQDIRQVAAAQRAERALLAADAADALERAGMATSEYALGAIMSDRADSGFVGGSRHVWTGPNAAVLDLAAANGFPLVARLDGCEWVDLPRRAA